MSPKLQLKEIYANIPVELANWLKEKTEKEAKSLSLVLTELLEDIRQREKQA